MPTSMSPTAAAAAAAAAATSAAADLFHGLPLGQLTYLGVLTAVVSTCELVGVNRFTQGYHLLAFGLIPITGAGWKWLAGGDGASLADGVGQLSWGQAIALAGAAPPLVFVAVTRLQGWREAGSDDSGHARVAGGNSGGGVDADSNDGLGGLFFRRGIRGADVGGDGDHISNEVGEQSGRELEGGLAGSVQRVVDRILGRGKKDVKATVEDVMGVVVRNLFKNPWWAARVATKAPAAAAAKMAATKVGKGVMTSVGGKATADAGAGVTTKGASVLAKITGGAWQAGVSSLATADLTEVAGVALQGANRDALGEVSELISVAVDGVTAATEGAGDAATNAGGAEAVAGMLADGGSAAAAIGATTATTGAASTTVATAATTASTATSAASAVSSGALKVKAGGVLKAGAAAATAAAAAGALGISSHTPPPECSPVQYASIGAATETTPGVSESVVAAAGAAARTPSCLVDPTPLPAGTDAVGLDAGRWGR